MLVVGSESSLSGSDHDKKADGKTAERRRGGVVGLVGEAPPPPVSDAALLCECQIFGPSQRHVEQMHFKKVPHVSALSHVEWRWCRWGGGTLDSLPTCWLFPAVTLQHQRCSALTVRIWRDGAWLSVTTTCDAPPDMFGEHFNGCAL